MNYQVIRLLVPEEVRRITEGLANVTFADGKATSTGLAREVKNNLQVVRDAQNLSELDQVVVSAWERNIEFQAFAIPRYILTPLFSRYEPGMEYGAHVDGALMGPQRTRTDLAMTVFLQSPASYEGGELVVELPMGQQEIKLDAGEAIVYPASSLHRVARVTRGVRLAVVTWIQSAVPDSCLREILFDLSHASNTAQAMGNRDLSVQLTKAYQNLLRYAAHP
jgi:PKHD-type hydroxylase